MKQKLVLNYDYLLDFEKIEDVYKTIKSNSKHKEKIIAFHLFKRINFQDIYDMLENRRYVHRRYNVFLISEPKYRMIMSECMCDKIVNHLVSKYILFPIIEPRLIDMNVATRPNKGTKMAIYYMKKYINKLKINNDKVYALKCDIHKFFYSIDHQVLLEKLYKIIEDKDVYNLVKNIINSTNEEYISSLMDAEINKQKKYVQNLKISSYEKECKFKELNRIPKYQKGKGLPIGNMTSQIMAIFYLNDLDHFIKEVLGVKYYIRYMDDLILIHPDKKYLKHCFGELEKKIVDFKLHFNKKTQIYDIDDGVPFLGYKFKLNGKKLHVLLSSKTKKRIMVKVRKVRKKSNKSEELEKIKINYNGYLIHANSGSFLYNLR